MIKQQNPRHDKPLATSATLSRICIELICVTIGYEWYPSHPTYRQLLIKVVGDPPKVCLVYHIIGPKSRSLEILPWVKKLANGEKRRAPTILFNKPFF